MTHFGILKHNLKKKRIIVLFVLVRNGLYASFVEINAVHKMTFRLWSIVTQQLQDESIYIFTLYFAILWRNSANSDSDIANGLLGGPALVNQLADF